MRRRNTRESGNALVLSLLLLLVLTSAGLVAVQQTNTDLIVAGNVTRSAQALFASDSGMIHDIAKIQERPQLYVAELYQRSQEEGKVGLPIEFSSMSTNVPDPQGAGADQLIPVVWHDDYAERVRSLQGIAYQLKAYVHPRVINVPGYGVGQDDQALIFRMVDFQGPGAIPSKEEESLLETFPDDPYAVKSGVQVRTVARVLVGPMPPP